MAQDKSYFLLQMVTLLKKNINAPIETASVRQIQYKIIKENRLTGSGCFHNNMLWVWSLLPICLHQSYLLLFAVFLYQKQCWKETFYWNIYFYQPQKLSECRRSLGSALIVILADESLRYSVFYNLVTERWMAILEVWWASCQFSHRISRHFEKEI